MSNNLQEPELEYEQTIVDVLVNCPPSTHASQEPIHAVANAMGWTYYRSQTVVAKMVSRKLVTLLFRATAGAETQNRIGWWVKGEH